MQKYQSIISGTNGSVIRNVPVTVLKEDGSLAEIFLDREGQVPAPNPLVTDSRGVFYFYATNGRYSLRTSVDGITITDADAVLLNDPEEIATAGPIADAVLRAEAAAQRAEFAVEASGIPDLVSQAQNAVLDANAALQGVQSAAQLADDAKTQAASAKNAAELAQQASDTAKTGAENAQSLAEQAADQARVYAESIDPAQFVQKEVGKGLMTEVERTKLAGIADQATKNATDAALRDRSTHTGTQPITSISGLEGQTSAGVVEAVAMARTFTSVPSTFQAWEIVVTQPHLRKMIWSSTQSKYVRAPWHPVGQVGHFLRDIPAGFLEVRADVVLQSADFPDLAEYLGVTGSTFVLDEARGEFIRNLDSGRGKDAGRAVGSHQGDAGRNLTGHFATGVAEAFQAGLGGVFTGGVTDPKFQNKAGDLIGTHNFGISFDASTQWPTAAEFRVSNLAYRLAITY